MAGLDQLTRHAATAFLLMIAGFLFACSTGASDEELIASAKSYMAEDKLREAAIQLKNVLQSDSRNAEARYLMGQINMQIGNLPSAEKEFQRALELGWNAEAASTEKMRVMITQRRYKEVLDSPVTTESWTVSGKANALALEAIASLGEQDLEKANSQLESAQALDADAYDVLRLKILLQLAQDKAKDAEKTMSKARKLFPDNPELMLMAANLAVLGGQREKAVGIFEQVTQLGPDNIMTLNKKRAHVGILKLAIADKDFDRVHKSREAIVRSNVNDPEVNYYLALAAYEEKDFDRAEEFLQKILLVSSSHGPTLRLSGSVSYAKQDFEKAAYYLSKYVANHPEDNDARKLLGRAYLALGQYDQAQAEFNVVLEEHPDDVGVIALLGLSEISSGQVQSGITGLEKAVEMQPENAALKLQLARAYISDGQADKAIKLLDGLQQAGDASEQIQILKALAYLQGQDIQMAMSTARLLLAKSQNRADVYSLMGKIQLVAGDAAEARKYFGQATSINADHVDSNMNLARLDEQQGDIAAAKKRYLSVLDKDPTDIGVLTSLARVAAQQGDTASQIKWLEAARQADHKELASRILLAEVYLKQGNIIDAETLVRELDEVDPKNLAVLVVKSKLDMAQKRFSQAERSISEIIDARPELDLGYYLQALNQQALGNKRAALDNSRKAFALQPDALRNAVLLANLEQNAGNYSRAMELAGKIISAAPDSADGYIVKGDALVAMEKFQQALTNFDKAWTITKSRDIALRRFKLTRRLSGLNEAAPIITGWLEAQPDDVVALLELATAYTVAKKNAQAIAYFKKVLSLEPDSIAALNNLAWLYGLENDPRALELAKKAYTLQPESPSIIDTYGWILLKNNKTTEAHTMLKQAAEMLPDVAEVQYHYAKVLYRTGDTAQARGILETLIESGKDFDGRSDAVDMLAQ